MEQGIHFISGLPRSGSTLLSALLCQNPRFSAGVSTPVFQLFTALQTAMSGKSEFHPFFDDDKRRAILRGVFESYYAKIHRQQLVFDTNRAWCMKLAALDQLFPQAKVVCCVRPVAEIVDSLERVMQRNSLEVSRLVNFEGTTNVYSRADILNAIPSGLIGSAHAGLREAFYGPFARKLLLITYDSLARKPRECMEAIYDFIGEQPFTHDFDHVVFDTPDYDARLGLRGLHRVQRSVRREERQSRLPPDLARRFEAASFWNDTAKNPRGVRVV